MTNAEELRDIAGTTMSWKIVARLRKIANDLESGSEPPWAEPDNRTYSCEVCFERDEDGHLFGYVPRLPGVASQAESLPELRDEMRDALDITLASYLDRGEAIPWIDGDGEDDGDRIVRRETLLIEVPGRLSVRAPQFPGGPCLSCQSILDGDGWCPDAACDRSRGNYSPPTEVDAEAVATSVENELQGDHAPCGRVLARSVRALGAALAAEKDRAERNGDAATHFKEKRDSKNIQLAEARRERDLAQILAVNRRVSLQKQDADWAAVARAAGEKPDIMVASLSGRVGNMRTELASAESERDRLRDALEGLLANESAMSVMTGARIRAARAALRQDGGGEKQEQVGAGQVDRQTSRTRRETDSPTKAREVSEPGGSPGRASAKTTGQSSVTDSAPTSPTPDYAQPAPVQDAQEWIEAINVVKRRADALLKIIEDILTDSVPEDVLRIAKQSTITHALEHTGTFNVCTRRLCLMARYILAQPGARGAKP